MYYGAVIGDSVESLAEVERNDNSSSAKLVFSSKKFIRLIRHVFPFHKSLLTVSNHLIVLICFEMASVLLFPSLCQ